ncbi:hypothetical protein GJ496_003318 [Pomphorhynchus laevis]|nr:hypothetical protein GJ496_003318 [Pomphorhynchus laevis]
MSRKRIRPPLLRSSTEIRHDDDDIMQRCYYNELPIVCLTSPAEEGYSSFPINLHSSNVDELNSTIYNLPDRSSPSSSLFTSNSSSTTDCSSSISSTASNAELTNSSIESSFLATLNNQEMMHNECSRNNINSSNNTAHLLSLPVTTFCYLTDNGCTSIREKSKMYNVSYNDGGEYILLNDTKTNFREKSNSYHSSNNTSNNNNVHQTDRTLRSKVRAGWRALSQLKYSFDMSNVSGGSSTQSLSPPTSDINDEPADAIKNANDVTTNKLSKSKDNDYEVSCNEQSLNVCKSPTVHRSSKLQIPFSKRHASIAPLQMSKLISNHSRSSTHITESAKGENLPYHTTCDDDSGSCITGEQQHRPESSWRQHTRKLINRKMKLHRKPSAQWGTFLNVFADVLRFKKNKSKEWFQLGGHKGTFREGFRNSSLLKAFDENEMLQYDSMQSDIISNLIPKYYGKVIDDQDDREFIELEDLLATFKDPSVMDVKMGVRTYLERELEGSDKAQKPREDLYQKMICIDNDEPTEEEHSLKAITKLRYMVWRENLSSSTELGFRVEAIKKSHDDTLKKFQRSKTRSDVSLHLKYFVNNSLTITKHFIKRLQFIRETLCDSVFFKTHEFIGSSLLFVYDKRSTGIWLIDFAKTIPLPFDSSITHLIKWTLNSHEDGYLLGIDNLICILKDIRDELSVVRECDL